VASAFSRLRGPIPLAAFAALLTMIAAGGLFKRQDDPPDDSAEPDTEQVTTLVSLGTDDDARLPVSVASR